MSDSLRERAERRVDRKIKFYRNLKAYVLVDNWDSEDFRERKIEEEMMKLRN